jgi:membrane protein DedA with SNARE-associated domain
MISNRTVLVTLGSIAGALLGRLTIRLFGFNGLTMIGCMAGAITGYLISTRYIRQK